MLLMAVVWRRGGMTVKHVITNEKVMAGMGRTMMASSKIDALLKAMVIVLIQAAMGGRRRALIK